MTDRMIAIAIKSSTPIFTAAAVAISPPSAVHIMSFDMPISSACIIAFETVMMASIAKIERFAVINARII
jgi:hypothetical protein